jgi:uncharacterized membrane protein YfcA
VLAGTIASVAGFGIGSVLTPLLAVRAEAKLAVAAVSIPHVVGTAVRFWLLRGDVDRRASSSGSALDDPARMNPFGATPLVFPAR